MYFVFNPQLYIAQYQSGLYIYVAQTCPSLSFLMGSPLHHAHGHENLNVVMTRKHCTHFHNQYVFVLVFELNFYGVAQSPEILQSLERRLLFNHEDVRTQVSLRFKPFWGEIVCRASSLTIE